MFKKILKVLLVVFSIDVRVVPVAVVAALGSFSLLSIPHIFFNLHAALLIPLLLIVPLIIPCSLLFHSPSPCSLLFHSSSACSLLFHSASSCSLQFEPSPNPSFFSCPRFLLIHLSPPPYNCIPPPSSCSSTLLFLCSPFFFNLHPPDP